MTLYTSKAVAQWLGLTERRIRQMRDAGIIREAKPGLYDMKPTVQAYLAYLRNNTGDLNQQRAELTKTKKELAKLELDERKGDLHRTEDIEQALATMLMNFRTKVMSMPAKLAKTLASMSDNAEIYDLLKKETDEALDELSDYDTAFAVQQEGADDGRTDEEPE